MSRQKIVALLFLIPAIAWFFWSFILTDRALIYSSNSFFVRFQTFMWQFAGARVLQTACYIFIIAALYVVYAASLRWLRGKNISIRTVLVPVGLFVLLLALSNPALSYDLFNYMFDAKLVAVYHLDPHTHSAIDFLGRDDWVMFMRNIFFPTTYGYMWTWLSLIPFVIGLGKFLTTYIAFKLYALLGLMLLFLVEKRLLVRYLRVPPGVRWQHLGLLFLSPLFLIETLSSGHNDIWMMVLAFLSLALLFPGNYIFAEKPAKMRILFVRAGFSLVLLFASSEVKRSTALLLPVWCILAFGGVVVRIHSKTIRRMIAVVGGWWADLGALLLLAPLLTPLSRQFHPWYLVWALSFLPFVRSRMLRIILIGFSISSLLRYIPVLYFGTYTDAIETVQKTITWSALPLSLYAWYITTILSKGHKKT